MHLDASLKTSQKVISYQTLHFETSKKITFALNVSWFYCFLFYNILSLHVFRDSIGETCIYFKMTIFYDGNIVPIYADIMRINICGMANNIVTLFPLRLRPLYLNFQVAPHFLTHRHPILKRFEPENENYISATFLPTYHRHRNCFTILQQTSNSKKVRA